MRTKIPKKMSESTFEEIPPKKLVRMPKSSSSEDDSPNRYRARYPSEDLKPISKYRSNMSPYERERWLRDAVVYLRAYIAEGISREEIKNRLGMDDGVYDQVETRLVETEGARFAKMGTAHRYYYFMLRMEQCVRELDDFVNIHIGDDPRKSGVVGAVKAKANILKDTMTMGQELGIVQKRAKELRVLGELNLNVMPTDELKELYQVQMSKFESIIKGETKKLPDGYANILRNATSKAYEDADSIIDAEFSDEDEEDEEE